MTSFADLVAPLSADAFMADVYGREPAHFPAEARGNLAPPLDWSEFNTLLAIQSHWTERNLQLVFNGRPILAEHFCEPAPVAGDAPRAALARVEVFMAMGASLIANAVHEVSPRLSAMADVLGQQLLGSAEANLYCSFQNVQAFGPHYDLHEVFAVQCEGEKVWKIYANRAEDPIDPPPFTDEARRDLAASKGDLIAEILMRPGDMLYIPRGCFHDALASSSASLHVTFSVTPMSGRRLFSILEREALKDPAFRAYLQDHRLSDGRILAAQLDDLATRLGLMMRSPSFASDLAVEQLKRPNRPHVVTLPDLQPLKAYQATGVKAEIQARQDGAVMTIANTLIPLGQTREPAEWLLTRPAFSAQELFARYRHLDAQTLTDLIAKLVQAGLFRATN